MLFFFGASEAHVALTVNQDKQNKLVNANVLFMKITFIKQF